mmetsp:Transcript_43434/g.120170  ORF Transcript_43434/g.120170 Transcript_43434/m.120170 type:complete len:261 (-) Transcript_43434:1827-2609(-)
MYRSSRNVPRSVIVKGLSTMVKISRSSLTFCWSLFWQIKPFESVFRANICPVAGSLSRVTTPYAPAPSVPTRSNDLVSIATVGSSRKGQVICLDCWSSMSLKDVPDFSSFNRGSKPESFCFSPPLYCAKFRRSSSTAWRTAGSFFSRRTKSVKVGPSNKRHRTSVSEQTLTENSDGASFSNALSPKYIAGRRVASSSCLSSSPSPSTARSIAHSPLTMMYHTFWRSPCRTIQSPGLNVSVRKFCANCSFSSESKPCRRST